MWFHLSLNVNLKLRWKSSVPMGPMSLFLKFVYTDSNCKLTMYQVAKIQVKGVNRIERGSVCTLRRFVPVRERVRFRNSKCQCTTTSQTWQCSETQVRSILTRRLAETRTCKHMLTYANIYLGRLTDMRSSYAVQLIIPMDFTWNSAYHQLLSSLYVTNLIFQFDFLTFVPPVIAWKAQQRHSLCLGHRNLVTMGQR